MLKSKYHEPSTQVFTLFLDLLVVNSNHSQLLTAPQNGAMFRLNFQGLSNSKMVLVMTKSDQLAEFNKILTLNDILPGSRVRVKRHNAKGSVRQRLLDLGVMPNASILVVRAAPLNDPIELRLDATDITLRRREAATIEVIENQDD